MAGGRLNGADMATSGNWEDATPGDGDPAIIPPTNQHNIIDSGDSMEGINLGYLRIHPEFSTRFGEQGNPIHICSELVHASGSGGCFIDLDGDTGGSGPNLVTDEIVFNAHANARAKFELGCVVADPGAAKDVYAIRGDVLIKSTIAWNAAAVLHAGFQQSRASDLRLTVASGGPTVPKLVVNGGEVYCDSVVTQLNVCGGVHYQDTAKAVTMHVMGGRLVYNHEAESTDVTLCVVHAGATLDLLGNAAQKTFVRTIALPGSRIRKDDSLHTLNLLDLGATML